MRRTTLLAIALTMLLAGRPAIAADLSVSVEGVTGLVRDNVLAALSIYQERERENLSPARIRRLHAQAPEEMQQALQPFGFYRPKIESSLTRTPEGWKARYRIDPGPPVLVARVDLQITGDAADDPEFRRLIEDFPIKQGEALSHLAYEDEKRAFQKAAAERGYFDFNFMQHEIRVDLEAYSASVILHMDSGARYRFGEIRFEQDLLDPELVRRYARLSPGQPYSTAALLEAQTALADSDYYADIDVVADPAQAREHAVPVHIKLSRRKPSRYSLGLGYGTDTGPRGSAVYQRRYLNEEGHSLRTELRASDIAKSFTAGYFIPIRNPRTDRLALTAGYQDSNLLTYDSQLGQVGISEIVARGPLRETFSLSYQNETFTIGTQTGESTLLLPGVSFSRAWGEQRVYTREGVRLDLDVRGAARSVLSDTNLLQGKLRGKLILPVFESGRLIARGDIGSTDIASFSELPPSLRFFAGGDQSVRGYRYNSLGPSDASGKVIGGRQLLVGSVEYEHRITGDWSGAVFYDAGNALNNFTEPLKKGAGFGVRWRSPVGQIRVDLANALSDDSRPWRLHLNIGPDL